VGSLWFTACQAQQDILDLQRREHQRDSDSRVRGTHPCKERKDGAPSMVAVPADQSLATSLPFDSVVGLRC